MNAPSYTEQYLCLDCGSTFSDAGDSDVVECPHCGSQDVELADEDDE